jgi:hypothetical protein
LAKALDGVFIEKFDTAQGYSAGAAAPFFYVSAIQKILPQIFFGNLARRFIEILAQLSNSVNIQFLGAVALAFKLQVFDHPLS